MTAGYGLRTQPGFGRVATSLVILVVILCASIGTAFFLTTGHQTASTSRTSTATTSASPVVSTTSVTGTSVNSASDTFFNETLANPPCTDIGGGAIELLVVSNSTGAPVNGEGINAVNNFACDGSEQVVYLNNFTVGQHGWLTPVFPSEATLFGSLNFTVEYQGHAYQFSTSYPPFGLSCVTLRVPSGNVTSVYIPPTTPSYPNTQPPCPGA